MFFARISFSKTLFISFTDKPAVFDTLVPIGVKLQSVAYFFVDIFVYTSS